MPDAHVCQFLWPRPGPTGEVWKVTSRAATESLENLVAAERQPIAELSHPFTMPA